VINGSAASRGMATNVPRTTSPRSSTARDLDRHAGDTAIEQLLKIVKGPDFPTRGYIYGAGGIREAYTTAAAPSPSGPSAPREDAGGREAIIITELPYQVNKASLIEKISELRPREEDPASPDRDRVEPRGHPGRARARRGRIPQIVNETSCTSTPRCRRPSHHHAGAGRSPPQIVNLKEMARRVLRFRAEIVTRRTRYDLTRAEETGTSWRPAQGGRDLDLVIRLIRQAESPMPAPRGLDAAARALRRSRRARFLDMRLQRLTSSSATRSSRSTRQTLALIEEAEGLLASTTKLMGDHPDRAPGGQEEYGDARRTEILTETTELTIEDLLADEEMVVTISRAATFKRTHVEAYRSQRRGAGGVYRMEDEGRGHRRGPLRPSTHSYLLFFTNRRQDPLAEGARDPGGGPPGQGKAMVNLLSLGRGGGRERACRCAISPPAATCCLRPSRARSEDRARGVLPSPRGRDPGHRPGRDDQVMTARRTDGQREVMIATSSA